MPGKAFGTFEKRAPEKEVFPFQGIKRKYFSFPTLCKGKTRDFRYRSIKGFSWVGVEKQSVFAGRRKRIESESRSGIL